MAKTSYYSVTQEIPSENSSVVLLGSDNAFPISTCTVYILKALEDYVVAKGIDLAGKSVAVFGAGGGYVPVCFKKLNPTASVTAYETDPGSYDLLLANIAEVNVDVTAVNEDVTTLNAAEKFDVIFACPPYLPDVLKTLPISHPWENAPEATVYGGYKGFNSFQRFVDSASNNLKPGGVIATLHSKIQADDAANYLDANFDNIVNTYQASTDLDVLVDLVRPSFTMGIKK